MKKLLMLLALAAIPASACEKDLSVGAGLFTPFGVGRGLGVEPSATGTIRCGGNEFEGRFFVTLAPKNDSGTGHTVGGSALYRRYVTKGFFFSGGVSGSRLSTALYTKAAIRPRAGLGYRWGANLLRAEWLFQERQTPNRVSGFFLAFRHDMPLREKLSLRIEVPLTITRFYRVGAGNTPCNAECGGRRTGAYFTPYVGVVW